MHVVALTSALPIPPMHSMQATIQWSLHPGPTQVAELLLAVNQSLGALRRAESEANAVAQIMLELKELNERSHKNAIEFREIMGWGMM